MLSGGGGGGVIVELVVAASGGSCHGGVHTTTFSEWGTKTAVCSSSIYFCSINQIIRG